MNVEYEIALPAWNHPRQQRVKKSRERDRSKDQQKDDIPGCKVVFHRNGKKEADHEKHEIFLQDQGNRDIAEAAFIEFTIVSYKVNNGIKLWTATPFEA
jgi:hypothetical protein